MKKTKLVVSALLIVLIIAGWTACVLGVGKGEDVDVATGNYDQSIAMAEDYMDRGLYQKAITEYESAVSLKGKEADWASLLEAYRCRYDEDENIFSDYLSAAKKAVKAYPKNTDFCKDAVGLCLDDSDYESAYQYLLLNRDTGAADEELDQLYIEVRYSYSIDSASWTDRLLLCNGYYAVNDGSGWGIIAEDGDKETGYTMESCFSVGENTVYVCSSGEEGMLVDLDGLIQGKLSFIPTAAGVYSEDLVAIQSGETYGYYDILGDWQFGEYLNAGSFLGGTAAAETEEGWILISTSGETVSSSVYEDIKLNADGSRLKNGVMLAKKDGVYHLYDENGEQIGDFGCDDFDIVTDDTSLIAFQRDDLWGFVDLDGNEVIAPIYAGAKSFSNGLGAVYDGTYWGFIDTDGELVIEYTFLDADYFDSSGNCMIATASDTWQLLTRNVNE